MTRQQLPDRRHVMSIAIAWSSGIGVDHHIHVSFGFDDRPDHGGQIKEAFVASFRAASGLVALANDACILYSRCLQHGDTIEELAATMVEDRPEGAAYGKPASMMGAIARAAVALQNECREGTHYGKKS